MPLNAVVCSATFDEINISISACGFLKICFIVVLMCASVFITMHAIL